METKSLKWIEGDGYITATYSGSGNDTVLISSDENDGIDRMQSINVSTTKGNNPKTISVSLMQIGMREVFVSKEDTFVLSDGGTYNVLKNGV